MTNEEMLLTALANGTPITEFQPQNNKQAYLAYLNGLEIELPEPRTAEEALLYNYCVNGGGGSGGDEEELKITNAHNLFYNGERHDLMEYWLPLIKDCETFTEMFSNSYSLTDIPIKFDTSKGKYFTKMFKYCKVLKEIPELDTSNGASFTSMFESCISLKEIPELDTSNGSLFDYMVASCSALTILPHFDTSNGTDFGSMLSGCSALTTVPHLDIGKGTRVSYMFYNCKSLTNLNLYNIKITLQIGSGTSWGHLLTVDSLVHIIKELCTVTSSQTLTIGSANLEKIANLYCKITDDTTEKKPMELCESTDEGAMTLIDYASEKGWLIA